MLLINRFKYITNKYHLKNGMHVDMNLINKIVIRCCRAFRQHCPQCINDVS